MFEEVKEMIDSTIYTNGRGEVTAQNVNLAMQAIVEATEGKIVSLEENGLSSSGALKVWMWDEALEIVPTEEQIAENIATYNKLLDGNHSGVILCVDDIFPDGTKSTVSINVDAQAIDSVGESLVVLQGVQPKDTISNDVQTFTIKLNADGTMVVLYGEDSASSGPLRVWVPVVAELTEEQKVENADTFAKLINGYAGLVYMIYQDVDVEVDANGVYTFIQLAKIYALGTEDDLRIAYLISDAVEIALLPDGTVEI